MLYNSKFRTTKTLSSANGIHTGSGFNDLLQQEEPVEEKKPQPPGRLKIDQGEKEKKKGKKHKVKWMRRPMVMPESILEILDEDLRENAVRYLSNFLVEA
ncbi:hypothetical protein HPP92_022630 [Vanilla planifolia]|uniref:Uncharacterized protein n=1 Tax=Vanilla planifolia TaxID=51239 RepID=A0A835PUG5_VANPL|nr:hypothetical protein HPP92_022630 [Vanilla planifolia]